MLTPEFSARFRNINSVCAGRAKRTVRKVAQESADAAAASSPRRPAEATDPFDAALPFLTPAQRRNFVENDVTLDCLALLHDEDLDDLLEGDDGAKSSFRMRYPDPAAAERGPSVEEAAEMARREVERLRAEEEAREDARASSLGEKLDVKDPHWLFTEEPVIGATLSEAGYPRTAAGVVRYKQSLRDKVKAEERRLERKAEEAEKERRRKERQKARKAADAAAAAATDEHKDEEKEEKKRVRPQPPAAAFEKEQVPPVPPNFFRKTEEDEEEDSDDESDGDEGFFARMTGGVFGKAAPANAAQAEQAAIARGRMAIGTEHPMFPDNCGRCGAPNASKICGRCRAMHYCSAACQRADWPQHKGDCFNAELIVRPRA